MRSNAELSDRAIKTMSEENITDSPERMARGSSSVSGSVDTWQLHILGPDDLIPMESEINALREANRLNIAMALDRLRRPNDPHEPWCMAVVERNGVEYTSDQYPLNEKLTHGATP